MSNMWFILILLYISGLRCENTMNLLEFLAGCRNRTAETSPCPVYLTVNPDTKFIDQAQIIINWGLNCELPDTIQLFKLVSETMEEYPLIEIKPQEENNSGFYITNHTYGSFDLPGGWNLDEFKANGLPNNTDTQCFKYAVVGIKDNVATAMNCFKINPMWMQKLKCLDKLPLRDIFIPGTHCSECYNSDSYKNNEFISSFGYKQNFNVWSQLVYGIRFFNFDVKYVGNAFFIVSEDSPLIPLFWVTEVILDFVKVTKEVLFIDINFAGDKEHLKQLQRRLEKDLSSTALPTDGPYLPEVTMEVMRQNNRYLIVTLNSTTNVIDSRYLFPAFSKESIEYVQLEDMEDHINRTFTARESTPDLWQLNAYQGIESAFVLNPIPGIGIHTKEGMKPNWKKTILAGMTTRVRGKNINRELIRILKNEHWTALANIVVIDFALSMNLIQMAIEENEMRLGRWMEEFRKLSSNGTATETNTPTIF